MTRTNAYSVLCLITRAFAMWIFVATIVAMPVMFASMKQWDSQDALMFAFVGSALPIVAAIFVWIFADKLAKLALARPQQIVFDSDISVFEWQALAFSVIGLWQALAATVNLSYRLVGLIALYFLGGVQSAGSDSRVEWSMVSSGATISACVQLLLGISLLFGARGLVGLIRRYRYIGQRLTRADVSTDSTQADAAKPDAPPSA